MSAAEVCNASAFVDLPVSDVYLATLTTGYLIILATLGSLTLVMLGLYVEQLFFFLQNLHNWKPKDKAIYLLGLYPVYGLTSFVALLVPRSSVLDEMVASLYLSVCVYLFVTMLIGHFGGAQKMVRRLSHHPISLRAPPFCCCCFCLPNVQVTSSRLQILELVVLQYAVLKPILSFIGTVLFMDGKFINEDLSKTAAYTWINFLNMLSTTAALYGFAVTYKLSHALLERMCIKPKFICLQLVIIISNFQHVIIGVFVKLDVIPCDPPLNAKANGDRWHHIFLISEMFVISLFARNYYRRHVGDLPPDQMIEVDTNDVSTEVTATLSRHGVPGRQYGSTGKEGAHGVYVLSRDTATTGTDTAVPSTSSASNDSSSSTGSDEIQMVVSLEPMSRRKQMEQRTVATSTEDLPEEQDEEDDDSDGGGVGVEDVVIITSPQEHIFDTLELDADRIDIHMATEDSTDA